MPVDLDAVRKFTAAAISENSSRKDLYRYANDLQWQAIQLAGEVERLRNQDTVARALAGPLIADLRAENDRVRAQMSQPRALLVEAFQAACSENVELREALEQVIKHDRTLPHYDRLTETKAKLPRQIAQEALDG